MKKNILFALYLLFNLTSCNTTDPKLEPDLKLELKDVSCTEVWLQLTSTNIQIPNNISLLVNGAVKNTITLNTQDSLLYFDSLLPNQSYKFKIVANTNDHPQPTTNEVLAQTMDTTSHNFTWQTFTFGEHSSSSLYDVAIINENDIWAVGEIYMNDSLGNPDPKRFNAVKWNGSNWTVVRIPYNYQGEDFFNPIQSVFAFGANDIWFCGNGVIHWDGNNFNPMPIPTNVWGPYQMNKIWGSGGNDLYIVGNNGSIAHYGGSAVGWKKIESGTTLDIYDIWGNYNSKTQASEILCVASTLDINNGKEVMQISGTGVNKINNVGLPWSLNTLWFIPERKYFIGGDGLYITKSLGNNWIRDNSMPPYYKTNIRGSNYNDIWICGAFGLIMHNNGMSWHNFQNITFMGGAYGSIKNKNDVVVCSGLVNNGKALITIGRR